MNGTNYNIAAGSKGRASENDAFENEYLEHAALEAADTLEPHHAGAYLCKKCSVLRFDDRNLGGYEGLSRTDQAILMFDEDDWPRTFDLDYLHEDTTRFANAAYYY